MNRHSIPKRSRTLSRIPAQDELYRLLFALILYLASRQSRKLAPSGFGTAIVGYGDLGCPKMRWLGDETTQHAASWGEQRSAGISVLAVGDTAEWLRRRQPVPPGGRIILASFSDLSQDLLARVRPKLVLSPLLARDFDCIDLAQMLFALGFGGQYRVVSSEVPNPLIVATEIRSLCPGLDFGVLSTLPGT